MFTTQEEIDYLDARLTGLNTVLRRHIEANEFHRLLTDLENKLIEFLKAKVN